MNPLERHLWTISLELRLRRTSGDAFQQFFSDVMAKRHGADFVRVRPYGQLGDKGCDGYRMSNGQVFQCYGALNGDANKVDYLVGKMETDFRKALVGVGTIMKSWHMVHNLVDGLPVEAVLKLKELEKAHSPIKCGFIAKEALQEIIFDLPVHEIGALLGLVPTTNDFLNLQAPELRDVIARLMVAADEPPVDITPIEPVPAAKLEFNKLPNHWQSLIRSGWQNAHHVRKYFDQHHDPRMGDRVATLMNDRYRYLKAQSLSPGSIMTELYEFTAGVGIVQPARQVAAHALLAFLFESCDIFEDRPVESVS